MWVTLCSVYCSTRETAGHLNHKHKQFPIHTTLGTPYPANQHSVVSRIGINQSIKTVGPHKTTLFHTSNSNEIKTKHIHRHARPM